MDNFLPIQRNIKNGVIPYQIHEEELRLILENSSLVYPFLQNIDESGWTTGQKIISLLSFRIPYYVGPLNPAHQNKLSTKRSSSWIVRKEAGRITPWNFDKKVDEQKSAELFIKKMTNKCTYLIGEDVLPKNSLLYARFMLLNELNNIKYNGMKLPNNVKGELIREKFENNHERLTIKRLELFIRHKMNFSEKG